MNEEERRRIVNAATSRLRPKQNEDDTSKLLHQAQQITTAMREHIRPILRSGGWKDKPALHALILTLYIEAFHKAFDKDQLVNLCALLHTELAMENIESNPYDNDAGPDAISS